MMIKKTPKVQLIVATTNDGFIAQEQSQNSTTWTSEADKKFFAKKSKEIGFMLMGRPTYDTIGFPLPQRVTFVLTRDNTKITSPADWKFFTPDNHQKIISQAIFTNLSREELLSALAKHQVTQLAICGGARVYQDWLASGLVDEIWQSVEIPINFSQGISFLPADQSLEDNYQLESETFLTPETKVLHWLRKDGGVKLS